MPTLAREGIYGKDTGNVTHKTGNKEGKLPNLGKPQGINPFNKVVMASRTQDTSKGPKATGEGTRFVDANEHNKMGKDGFLKTIDPSIGQSGSD